MKKIKTTLNVHSSVLEELKYAVEASGLSRTEIIKKCLNEIMIFKRNLKVKPFKQVKYQDRDLDKDNWHVCHISFLPPEYEFCQDFRSCFKLSVSYIVAWAVQQFLSKILEKKGSDNYLLLSYVFEGYFEEGVQSWEKHWGLPKKYQNFESFL